MLRRRWFGGAGDAGHWRGGQRPLWGAATVHGGLAMIGGGAGVGKTRLCEEVAAEARDRGFFNVVGHCYDMAAKRPPIDLVITDLIMPGMDGLALIGILAPFLGLVPVLLMSGYAEEAVIARANSRTGVEFIPKPIKTNNLLEKVQGMFTARRRNA